MRRCRGRSIERRQYRTDGWTRANAGEVFPAPMTPLTWALTGERLDHGFAAMFRKPAWTDGRRFVALFDGYLYFNFGLVYDLNINRLGAPSRQTVNMVGGPGSMEGLRVSDRGLNPLAMLRNVRLISGDDAPASATAEGVAGKAKATRG